MPGATAATAILTCFAVAATLAFDGPHSEQTKNAAASGMQQFLLIRVAPLYLVAVLLEQSRRIQHSLSDSERRFRDMADNAPVMIWLAGAEGCEFANKGWLDFRGRALSQERGDGWSQGLHPDDQQRCLASYQASFAARCEFELDYRIRRRDGEYRWILARGVPRYDDKGDFIGFIGRPSTSPIDANRKQHCDRAKSVIARWSTPRPNWCADSHPTRR